MTIDTVSAPAKAGRTRGYAEIGIASLILGTSGALLQIAVMPASLVLVARMALAGLVLGPFFFFTGGVAEVRRSGQFWRLVLIGCTVSGELVFYFAAIRLANVTIGISLEYMAPVYVALAAPWVLHTRRERSDMVAVAVAAVGMVFVVVPSLSLAGSPNMVPGVGCGIVAGGLYATALLLMKGVGGEIRGTTFTLFFCVCTVVLVTPLAVWQTMTSHYHLTGADVAIVAVMGLVYTALCFSLFTDGLRFVPIAHAGILGYLEPVTAPLWALLLVGERPPVWTWLGGALIIGAGVYAVSLGRAQAEMPV